MRGPKGIRLLFYGSQYGIGGVAETVTVTAAEGGGRRGIVNRQIQNLPLNARADVQFLMLDGAAARKAPAAADDRLSAEKEKRKDGDAKNEQGGGGGPRVRSFFPETLYTNPALITDGDGRASVNVPLADSITTWRVTSLASTVAGTLGSSTAPVRVFQDFFVYLDLPSQ